MTVLPANTSVDSVGPAPGPPALCTPQDYEECFMSMVNNSTFQNVAARMFTGNTAYNGSAKLCLDKQQAREAGDGEDCALDLHDVIQGACYLNYFTMW